MTNPQRTALRALLNGPLGWFGIEYAFIGAGIIGVMSVKVLRQLEVLGYAVTADDTLWSITDQGKAALVENAAA